MLKAPATSTANIRRPAAEKPRRPGLELQWSILRWITLLPRALSSSSVRRSEPALLYQGAGVECTWVLCPGIPHVTASSPPPPQAVFSPPSTPALPKSWGVEECTLESALEAENTPLLLLLLGTVLGPPCPSANREDPSEPRPSCEWGGPAGSPHSPIIPFPGILTQLSFCPLLTSVEAVSRVPGVGQEGQAKILNNKQDHIPRSPV